MHTEENKYCKECFNDFFTNAYQRSLIQFVQQINETYEESLKEYGKLFCSKLMEFRDNSKIDNYCKESRLCNRLIELFKEWDESSDDAYKSYGDIFEFFSIINEIYAKWIDFSDSKSFEIMKKLLYEKIGLNKTNTYDRSSYDNIVYKKIKNKDIFFRGRLSEAVVSKDDIFHIPFKKLYLIKNERFSTSGRPLLYLGSSIENIVTELCDKNDEVDYKKLKISIYQVKLPEDDEIKVFDARIKMNWENILSPQYSLELFKYDVYRFVLSCVCAFERKSGYRDSVFCEEYIIPQILTQSLKNLKIVGVCYYSTRVITKARQEDKKFENIAFFTNKDKDGKHGYDMQLRSKFDISMPISFNDLSNLKWYDKLLGSIGGKHKDKELSEINIKLIQGIQYKNNIQMNAGEAYKKLWKRWDNAEYTKNEEYENTL